MKTYPAQILVTGPDQQKVEAFDAVVSLMRENSWFVSAGRRHDVFHLQFNAPSVEAAQDTLHTLVAGAAEFVHVISWKLVMD